MKLFILTQCAAEQNYTPQVFLTEREAKTEFNKEVDEAIYKRDVDGEIIDQYTDNFEIYANSAEVIYDDDTYCKFNIFTVEVPVSIGKRKESLLDDLLNDRCDLYGVTNTIQLLFDLGFTPDEIKNDLDFDEEAVDKALAEDNMEDFSV